MMSPKKRAKQLDAEIAAALAGPPSVRYRVPTVSPRGRIAPPARGFVRLYRGTGGGLFDPSAPTHGEWFTTVLSSAQDYAGTVEDEPLPPGTAIFVIDVHGDDVARMPTTTLSVSGYAPVPLPEEDQEWLRSPSLLREAGPPDVEVRVPAAVARAATRLTRSRRA
jgi:hypothetical protein